MNIIPLKGFKIHRRLAAEQLSSTKPKPTCYDSYRYTAVNQLPTAISIMDCKAISVFLVVLAVAVPTQAISCLQCASFDLAGATEAQQYMAVGILTALCKL